MVNITGSTSAGAIVMIEMRPSHQQCLNNHISYLPLHLSHSLISFLTPYAFHYLLQTPLEIPLIFLEFLTLLVYCVICEMHEQIVFTTSFHILLSGKSSQSIVIYETMQSWSDLSHQHINAQVKFPILNKIRRILVLLDHIAAISGDIFDFPG
jgi:hypothetical protein